MGRASGWADRRLSNAAWLNDWILRSHRGEKHQEGEGPEATRRAERGGPPESDTIICPKCSATNLKGDAFDWSFTAPASLQDVPDFFYKEYIRCRKMVSFKADDHFTGFVCTSCGEKWIVQEVG